MAEGVVKPYYDAANQSVDEQAIQDKFNAATIAQFNAQREQNRQAENQFYNQMYNTQRTAMDTIRQANAAAVSTGASRGVQAANELSALLGLEQESVASATELAQANRQTAQEETAAMLENALNAYQQAAQERSQLVSQGIEAASLGAQQTQAEAAVQANAQKEIETYANMYTQALANGDAAGARVAWERLQQLNTAPGNTSGTKNDSNNTTIDTQTTPTVTPIFKSGIQEDGSLAFSTGDLNTKNYNNIRAALAEYGYDVNMFDNELIDITDTADYDKIKQYDFDSSHQTGDAKAYIDAIRADAAANKIPVGSIIQSNYGAQAFDGDKPLVYLGNNKFMKVNGNNFKNQINSEIYVPEGYKADTRYYNTMGKVVIPNERSTLPKNQIRYKQYFITKA